MLELILEPVLVLLLFGGGYVIGFLPTVILSLGAMEPGPLSKIGDREFYRGNGMRWWHLTYQKDGKTYLPAEGVAAIGWILLLSGGLMAWAIACCLGTSATV